MEPETRVPDILAINGGKIVEKLLDLDESLIHRLESVTFRERHIFLRRRICFAHRGFNEVLDAYQRGDGFYLYVGQGLSTEGLRFGDLAPLKFAKYLQDAFKVSLVIQLTDDDALRKKLTVEERQKLARENAKNIIACGFDVARTCIFYVRDHFSKPYYHNVVKFGTCVPLKEAMDIMLLDNKDYTGKLSELTLQAVPSFSSSFPDFFPGKENLHCLIPCSIDQDPFLRMARDVAPRLGYCKPALIESSVFPALEMKVSASGPSSAISVTDTPDVIKEKIKQYVYNGWKETKKDQQDLGANLEIDVLSFFLEDDAELELIKHDYVAGKMLPEAVTERLIQVLSQVVETHHKARGDVSDEIVDAFMTIRSLLSNSDSESSSHIFAASLRPSFDRKLHRAYSPDATVDEREQVVSPWKVSTKDGKKIDYDRYIETFDYQRLDKALIDRVERVTSRQPHLLLRNGVFFAHRDFNEILDAFERGEKFYLYTGRGPSSKALHLGHLVPFMFTKYLQEAFKVPLVIQLTDDEQYMWKNLTVEESQRLARENAKDVIACGFDATKTFIFSDFDFVGGAFYDNMQKVADNLTIDKAIEIYGFSGEDHIGKISFPPVQAAPSFPNSFPHLFAGKENLRCLIPCAIDQDPYFRMTRDVAPGLGYSKPALIESSFLPALKGENGKMSASDPNSAIYVTDTAEDIKKKINRAFSGGKDSAELQRIVGVFVEYLHFFLEDGAEIERIKKEYEAGMVLPEAVKNRLIEVLTEIVERHKKARAGVTDEMVDALFMARRPLPSMFRARRCPVIDSFRNANAKKAAFKKDKEYEPLEPHDPLGFLYNGFLTICTQGLFRRLEFHTRHRQGVIDCCNGIASRSHDAVAQLAAFTIREPSLYSAPKTFKGAAGIYSITRVLVPTIIGGLVHYLNMRSESKARKEEMEKDAKRIACRAQSEKSRASHEAQLQKLSGGLTELRTSTGDGMGKIETRVRDMEKMMESLLAKKSE